MYCKQNQKINQVKECTLVVGIDIGSTTHYARAFDWRGIELGNVFKCLLPKDVIRCHKHHKECMQI